MNTKSKIVYSNHNNLKNIQKEEDKLSALARLSNTVLFETKSIFPFEIFPDKITICLNRIAVSYNTPFLKDERPIPIEFINTAHITRGYFFSTLSIETFGVEKPNPISHLKTNEARIARRYILALVECKKNGVDFRGYEIAEIKKKLLEIGKVRE
jgi:hypothetical protein